ncbi:MAG: ubiquinol-cytochrome c chaperone [Beijerinckiaceae bacterium]|nr:ubiquinol-cytochrome c chaperone [Beijerinckiaceae bacterium]
MRHRRIGAHSPGTNRAGAVRAQRGQNVFRLFRRSPNKALIDRLNGEIMAAARQPSFFLDYGVADTVEGRFELLCLVATTVMRRMEKLPSPGPELAQDVTDALFTGFDIALREIGVGDLTVPKKMKKMAQGWLGRGAAYRVALDAGDPAELARAIARNVYGDEKVAGEPPAQRLARYAFAQDKLMHGLDLDAVLKGPLGFVDPASVPA